MLSDVIDSFATSDGGPGYYWVTRRPAKVPVNGIFVAPATSQFKITAVREPETLVGGRNMKGVEQGQYVDDVQVLYTSAPLYTRTAGPTYNPLFDPDLIAMLSGTYEVFSVQRWELSLDVTYRVVTTRLNLGAS